MEFKDNLRKYRKKAKLSQPKLAEKINISVRQIQKYEAGVQVPTINTARDIANALGISLDNLASTNLRDDVLRETECSVENIVKNFKSGELNKKEIENVTKTIVKEYCEKTGNKSVRI